MYLLGIGLVLMLMKYLEIGPPAAWSWWIILAPFALATVWWWYADWSGYTKRKAMQKEQAKKQARIDTNRAKMGMQPKNRR